MVYAAGRTKLVVRECAWCTAIALAFLVSLPVLAVVAFALRPVVLVAALVAVIACLVSAVWRAQPAEPPH